MQSCKIDTFLAREHTTINESETVITEDFTEEMCMVFSPASKRYRRILNLVASFMLGQGALQGLNVVIGLFLVRSLSISDYAKFGLASGFQATIATLMDLGCASTIIPLVGQNIHDRAVVGRYTKGVQSLRDRAFWIMCPFAGALFLTITLRQHWPWKIQAVLLSTVLLALYSSGPASYYAVALFLHRKMRGFYFPQIVSSVCRLVLYGLLNILSVLNAWTAAGLNALNVAVNGYFMARGSRPLMDWPHSADSAVRKEIRRYILPAAPAIILGAFHGQIALLVVSLFGSTVNIAQVAALGRLGQIFNVMMVFNVVIVEPYVARLRSQQLAAAYARMTALAVLGGIVLSWLAFKAPGIFSWILGPKYATLRDLMGWVVTTACINYVAGLIWIMNRSRKWVFWRGTIAEISLLLVVQPAFVIFVGMHSTRAAVLFNFASSFCYLISHTYVAVHGFTHNLQSGELRPVEAT